MSLTDLIPSQYKLIVGWLVVALLMALSATAAWQWQANSYGKQLAEQAREHQTHLRQTAEANAAVILQQQRGRQALQSELVALDQQRYGELRHAQQQLESLTAALADGNLRLSVRARCPATGLSATAGPGRLDAGAQRVELHAADAAAIVRITGDADTCAVKLTALQEWARLVTRPHVRSD